ncbi:anti-sigma factor [Rugamonas sp.]|uniref:anti-sigma factor family protein n=1 Tax=Rugamonas sp. TaxID=1926287 RepID=UPI0025F49AA6|nr:anti-sigma factor [Rugamonas sp.]
MNASPVTEAELHAWVDGVLPAARQADVAAYLAARPVEAERLHAYRQQAVALRTLYNPVLDEALPGRLDHIARPAWRLWRSRRAGQWARGAAMLALTLAGGGAGWLLHGAADRADDGAANADHAAPAALAQRAAVAYAVYTPEVRHPVEVGADQQEHLVAWLSKRLGAPLRPPQLQRLGYELMGGRLLPGQSGPVAQFMYHDAGGQRLTLYVSTEQSRNSDTGFRFAQEGRVGVFYWIDGKFGYALSAAIGKDALGKIADAVYVQLQPAP